MVNIILNVHSTNHQKPRTTVKATHYCSICQEGIYNGEEYIENDDGEYAHWDCIDYGRDLVKWLGYEIKEMEEIDDEYNI